MVEALKRDWQSATLSARERAMLVYCDKLTREPASLGLQDIQHLRQEGLSDDEVLGVVMLAGFFQLATRIADALGVELDRELTRGTPEYEWFMEQGQP